ncbi:MAG: hypothetical protein II169_01860 [Lachnospiraceae bacterium]|nr:hypothetical protein [Lachnospiraceae bacterium]
MDERGVDSHAKNVTILQSRAINAPFLRLADAGRLKLHTTFVMDDRRI